MAGLWRRNLSSSKPRRAAVVVGGNLNALGVTRALARANIPVILISRRPDDIAAWSRHCVVETVGSYEGEPLIAGLYRARARAGHDPFLMLTDEDAVRTVSENRTALLNDFRFDLPDQTATRALERKIDIDAFARREGFAVPYAVAISREADMAGLDRIEGPIIVKPSDKTPVRGLPMERTMLTRSRADAIARCRELVAAGAGALAQEWIDGDDSSLYFCLFYADARGEPFVIFTGRKLVAYPPRVGSTAVCAPAQGARLALEPIARRFARLAGMVGPGGVEFKWDARRKLFVIIEPTVGRTDWQAEVATLAGVNIPLEGYRHATGEETPRARRMERQVAWRSSRAHRVAGLPRGAAIHDGYWRANDPWPAYAYYIHERAKRLSRRLFLTQEARGATP